ncbi:MAG: hypothetical protein KAX39_01545 [candidate division Zixibacteria bacterium]|nr:hypothetical protein [candidate division Zixibacteria bacterium]
MAAKEKGKVSFEHQGDHHLARITADPRTKKVSAGAICNFSDHASAAIQIHNGKLKGTIIHSGDTHALRIDVKNDGTFLGTYRDSRFGGLEIYLKDDVARVKKGKIPVGGITVNGDNHKLRLKMSPAGKLSGVIQSKALKNCTFRINLQDGNVEGAFVHRGKSHKTEVTISPRGWKAGLSVGKGKAKLSFNVEGGRVKKAFGGIAFDF